jgi:AmpD protein
MNARLTIAMQPTYKACTIQNMMVCDRQTGIVQGARQVCSPNCDARPVAVEPELILLHGISLPPREFGGPWIEQLFTNRLSADAHPYFAQLNELRVSAHFLIRRDGELVQYVPTTKRAWHAGDSCFDGRDACNDYSIGIELEGADDVAYEDAQYAALAELVAALRAAVPSLATGYLAGHCDVAPGRKTDPGPAFDWAQLQALLAKQLTS